MKIALRVLLLALLGVTRLQAHAIGSSFAIVEVREDSVEVDVRLRLADLGRAVRLDRDGDGAVGPAELEAEREVACAYLRERIAVRAGDDRIEPTVSSFDLEDPARLPGMDEPQPVVRLRLDHTLSDDGTPITVEVGLFREVDPEHACFSRIRIGAEERGFVFRGGAVLTLDRGGRAGGLGAAGAFLRLGVMHLLTGWDHILFVVSLMVVVTSARSLLAVVTAFTVGHSVTLALATLGLVSAPAGVVEPLIALSIAYVALENLAVREPRHRAAITFVFGLVHGLGFSTILREMSLGGSELPIALASFNVGVELGQLAVIAVALPVLGLLRARRPALTEKLLRWGASPAIAVIAGMWYFQRM